MARPMFSLEPVDETYFDHAPLRFARSWSIDQPAESVWAEIVSDDALHWCRGLRAQWTSPRPFGIGATRRAVALGAMPYGRFFIWEEGRRHSFYFTHIRLPLFVSAAEDYLVEPDGSDRCRFTWRVAITPNTIGRAGAPLMKLMFHSFFRDTGRYFAARPPRPSSVVTP
jgi:Polyketide cyclase / dehydrase and lipid transport.